MHHYQAYSLNISSEIEFPEFLTSPNADADVKIIIGATPDQLQSIDVVKKVRYQVARDEALYNLKGAGKIYITNGNLITVEPEKTPDWEHLKNHIRGRALAAALHQRKWPILHGSAICSNDKAVIFIGQSGAGKSTFLGSFIKKGYDFITDDLCLIKASNDNAPHISPGYPQIRLWQSSIDLIQSKEHLKKERLVRTGLDKYFMTPKTEFVNRSVNISPIYILSATQESEVKI